VYNLKLKPDVQRSRGRKKVKDKLSDVGGIQDGKGGPISPKQIIDPPGYLNRKLVKDKGEKYVN